MPGWLAGVVRPGRNAPWSFPWKCSTFCWNVATPCSRSSWKRGATATTTPEERQAWPVVDCWARTYKSSYRPLRYFNKHVWIFAWGFFGWGGRNAKHFADREIIESALPAHKGCAMLAISRLGSFDYLLDWVRSHSIFCYYLFIPDFYGLFVFIFVVFFYFLCPGVVRLASVPQFRLESTAHLPWLPRRVWSSYQTASSFTNILLLHATFIHTHTHRPCRDESPVHLPFFFWHIFS